MDLTYYSGRRVLVTGGLGFIGSNLSIRLAEAGARVTIVDSSVEGCGADERNIAPVRGRVEVIASDVADAAGFAGVIRESEVIFNLAGELSHTQSMSRPQRDMALNATAQLRFVEVCRRARPGVRIVYAGTRQVYGRPLYVPVDESHPLQVIDYNAIHKLAAAQYHLLMASRGELDAVVLRLTNIYGPRMSLRLRWQGFLASFVREAMLGNTLSVYGEGKQERDPLFVDDAVNAFLLAGAAGGLRSRVYNVGGPEALSLASIARAMARASGNPGVRHVPYPDQWRTIEIGSYVTDSSRIRKELGWRAASSFREGLRRTFEFYRSEAEHYLGVAAAGAPRAEKAPALEPVAAV